MSFKTDRTISDDSYDFRYIVDLVPKSKLSDCSYSSAIASIEITERIQHLDYLAERRLPCPVNSKISITFF